MADEGDQKAKEVYKYDLKNFYREKAKEVKSDSYGPDLKKFYTAKAKAKNGKGVSYGYDVDGNLVVREKETVIKTIALPTYRRPTAEEIDMMEKQHHEAIALANRAVDDARTALYAMSQNPERDDPTMVRLNRAVLEADSKLCMARFPLFHIEREEGIKIKQLDFTQPNETRVLPYPVAFIETRPFSLQEQYVRIGEPAAAPLVSVAEAKSMIKAAGVPIILFEGADSNEYGYLSMEWAVVLEYHSTTYHSVYQAVYSELAKFFDDQEHLPQLLAAKTADEIVYSVEDVPGDVEQNREKWNEQLRKLIDEINLVKFRRYPELAAKLLETKNAMIGAYEPGDQLIGIGISLDTVESKDPSKWGDNILGKTLMNIRDILRAEQPTVPVKKGKPAVATSVVTSAATSAVPISAVKKRPSVAKSVTQAAQAPIAPVITIPSMAIATPSKPSVAKPSVAKPSAVKPSVAKPSVAKPSVAPIPMSLSKQESMVPQNEEALARYMSSQNVLNPEPTISATPAVRRQPRIVSKMKTSAPM